VNPEVKPLSNPNPKSHLQSRLQVKPNIVQSRFTLLDVRRLRILELEILHPLKATLQLRIQMVAALRRLLRILMVAALRRLLMIQAARVWKKVAALRRLLMVQAARVWKKVAALQLHRVQATRAQQLLRRRKENLRPNMGPQTWQPTVKQVNRYIQ
jgi:hypothetical protein